jgi:transketolase
MLELAREYDDLVALGADGASIFGELARQFPQRYIDVGIAEANLVGVASGLARAGKRPMVGSIASFLTRRAYEQIRTDICEPNLPVTLIGVGCGVSYGLLGATHHASEDISLFRSMPNCAIFGPSDTAEAEWALRRAAAHGGPVYIRLPAREDPALAPIDAGFPVGAARVHRVGAGVAIVATGISVAHALDAAEELDRRGHSVCVIGVPTLRPLDVAGLRELLQPFALIVSVEEHQITGGLASLLRDSEASRAPIVALGLPVASLPIGTREHIQRVFGLDAAGIVKSICDRNPGAS